MKPISFNRQIGLLILSLALPLSMAYLGQGVAHAELRGTKEFAAIDQDSDGSDGSDAGTETEEEVVVVRELPRQSQKVRKKIVRREVVREDSEEGASEAADESLGQRLSKRIDQKMEADRKQREAEMRRKQKEQEDKIVSRIDHALSDEERAEQSQEPAHVQVVQEKVYTTVGAEEYERAGGEIYGENKKKSAKQGITISPNIGGSSLSSDNYDISMGTAYGINVGFGLDENIVLDVGYAYSSYDITLAYGSNFYNGFNNYYNSYYNYNSFLNNNLNKLEYHQNVIDSGIKYMLFDRSSKVRPYIGGGGAYTKGYLNYPQQTLNYNYNFNQNPFNANNGTYADYEISNWAGFFQLGAVVNLSDSFGIGLNFRYYKIISSDENYTINNYGFINNGYNFGVMTDKQIVSGTLKDSDFQTYNISLNLTF